MISVRRLRPDDWQVWRAVRLAALGQAPGAFGSTLAREQRFTESDWRGRLGPGGVKVVATLGESAETVGCAGGVVPAGADAVLLIAMWISPGHRGRGIGDALVTEVVDWARENGWSRVVLDVADGNDAARRLFLRNGFEPTGQRAPLPSNPAVETEVLARKVS